MPTFTAPFGIGLVIAPNIGMIVPSALTKYGLDSCCWSPTALSDSELTGLAGFTVPRAGAVPGGLGRSEDFKRA